MQLSPTTFPNNNHVVCAQPSIWCCFIFPLWYSFLSASLSYIFNPLAQAQDAWCAGKTPLTGASAGQTASFVVLLIDREAPREALLESDSRLLLGTSQRVALPPLPTGVKGVHCTSVHQGRWSYFPGRWSTSRTRRLRLTMAHKRVDDIEDVWGFTGRCHATRLSFIFPEAYSSPMDWCSWPKSGDTQSGLPLFYNTAW